MYESHFGFTSRPFSATPNADCFFPTLSTKQAFDSVVSCIDRASGAALVVGGSGMGKSLFLQVLGRHFQKSYSVAVLESASLTSRRELLQSILFELGLPYRGMEEGELRLTLMDYLKPGDRCPNGLLLCVDEAHLLQANLLEEMRMITNLVREGKPRARLVLAGSPSIEERMTDPKLESLNQRIVVRAYLEPMSQSECREYIKSSMEYAGQTIESIFDEDSIEAIFIATNGVPRLINQVCDHGFVLALADGKERITSDIINESWSDIQRLPVQWHVMGLESESKNEHVIEFGSLDSDQDQPSEHETLESDSSMEWEHAETSGSEASMTTDLEAEQNSTGQDSIDSPETENEPEELVEEKKEFVFEGPSNPFLEIYSEEEIVIDSFSKVIGHSPQKPQRPMNPTGDPVARQIPDVHAIPDVARSETPTDLTEQESPGAAAEETPSEPVPDSLKKTLQDYYSQNTDSITFGVGQGLTADSYSPMVPEQPDEPRGELEDSSGDGTETTSQASDEQPPSTSPVYPTIADPGLVNTSKVTPLSAAEFSSLTNLDPSLETGNQQNVQESDPSDPTQNQLPVQNAAVSGGEHAKDHPTPEELIDESVTGIEEDLKSVSIAEAGKNSDSEDDRDMIIVEEETQNAPTVESLPIRDHETPNAPRQAKREDYQRLFDRLRKG